MGFHEIRIYLIYNCMKTGYDMINTYIRVRVVEGCIKL